MDSAMLCIETQIFFPYILTSKESYIVWEFDNFTIIQTQMIIAMHIKIVFLSLVNQNYWLEDTIKLQMKTRVNVHFSPLYLSQIVSRSKLLPDSSLWTLVWCNLFLDELREFQYLLSLQVAKAYLNYSS